MGFKVIHLGAIPGCPTENGDNNSVSLGKLLAHSEACFLTYKNLPDGVNGKMKETVYRTLTMGPSTYKRSIIVAILKTKIIIYIIYKCDNL